MPINTPQVNTQIGQQDYRNPASEQMRDAMLKLSLQSMQGADQAVKTNTEGKQKIAQMKAGEQQEIAKEGRQKETLEDILKGNPNSSVKVGDIDVNNNSYMRALTDKMHGENTATQKANATYEKGLPDLQKKAFASAEGLKAINDPQQIGSIGQARSLMLRSMGMNRYNEQEASASLPPDVLGYAGQLFNKADGWQAFGNGADDKNPLSTTQRQAAASFFNGSLGMVKQGHELLKKTAIGQYNTSNYADPTKSQILQQTLGAPFDEFLNQTSQKPQNAPQQPQAGAQGATPQAPPQQPPAGILGGLQRLLKGAPAQQPQAPAPQGPPPFDPNAYLKGN